jgi:glutamyl/glutaminyl-tRNA synthetase
MGYLHVGGAHGNFQLSVRAIHGTFICASRIPTWAQHACAGTLLEDLAGRLDWDEGPDVGGPYGPYRQSERMATYREITDKLVAAGHAYPCFCTEEELERKRAEMEARHEAPHYDGTCRNLSAAEVAAKRAARIPEAVRFRVGEGAARFEDAVRGSMDLGHDMVGDWVILRSNGLPTTICRRRR